MVYFSQTRDFRAFDFFYVYRTILTYLHHTSNQLLVLYNTSTTLRTYVMTVRESDYVRIFTYMKMKLSSEGT